MPTEIIGSAYLSLVYKEEGHTDLAYIHRMTPKQALTALVYLSGLDPVVSKKVFDYTKKFYGEES